MIFSAPMVQALLEDRKMQTRRLFGGAPLTAGWRAFNDGDRWVFEPAPDSDDQAFSVKTRYTVGDRIWVKENYATDGPIVRYEATDDFHELRRKKPSIYMPRWASRITLTITDVRVQKLHDISEADAEAEGFAATEGASAIDAFRFLWDELQSKAEKRRRYKNSTWRQQGAKWGNNPWVYALTFDVREGNIDRPDR